MKEQGTGLASELWQRAGAPSAIQSKVRGMRSSEGLPRTLPTAQQSSDLNLNAALALLGAGPPHFPKEKIKTTTRPPPNI